MAYSNSSMHHIVLIEDNEPDAFFLTSALEDAKISCRITHLADGLAGRKYIAEDHLLSESPDLILLDLHIPNGDGLALLSQVRASKALACVPVFIWSSVAPPTLPILSSTIGIDGFFLKPGTLKDWGELADNLKRLLSRTS